MTHSPSWSTNWFRLKKTTTKTSLDGIVDGKKFPWISDSNLISCTQKPDTVFWIQINPSVFFLVISIFITDHQCCWWWWWICPFRFFSKFSCVLLFLLDMQIFFFSLRYIESLSCCYFKFDSVYVYNIYVVCYCYCYLLLLHLINICIWDLQASKQAPIYYNAGSSLFLFLWFSSWSS